MTHRLFGTFAAILFALSVVAGVVIPIHVAEPFLRRSLSAALLERQCCHQCRRFEHRLLLVGYSNRPLRRGHQGGSCTGKQPDRREWIRPRTCAVELHRHDLELQATRDWCVDCLDHPEKTHLRGCRRSVYCDRPADSTKRHRDGWYRIAFDSVTFPRDEVARGARVRGEARAI